MSNIDQMALTDIQNELKSLETSIAQLQTEQNTLTQAIADGLHTKQNTDDLETRYGKVGARLAGARLLVQRLADAIPGAAHNADLRRYADLTAAFNETVKSQKALDPYKQQAYALLHAIEQLESVASNRESRIRNEREALDGKLQLAGIQGEQLAALRDGRSLTTTNGN